MLGLQFSARIKNAVILYMCCIYIYICMYILAILFSHVESKSQEDRICNVNLGDTQTKVSPETVTRFDIKQMYKYSAISTFLPSEKGNSNAIFAFERNLSRITLLQICGRNSPYDDKSLYFRTSLSH